MKRLASLIENNGRLLVLIGILVAIPAIWTASHLRVDQNFRKLLPSDAPEVLRLEQTDATIGNQSDLIIAIRSPDRDANIRFGHLVSEALEKRTDLSFRYVLFHQDSTFFEKNALLYASLSDLLDLRDRVRRRIKKAIKKGLDLGLDDPEDKVETVEDDLSQDSLKERYNLDKRLREYMEADEGRVVVIKARPEKSNSDIEYSQQLTGALESIVERLKPKTFHPELSIQVEGSYAENTRRVRNLQGAIVSGTLACLVILLLSIAFYFRSFRAVFWVLAPLLLSVICALAFAYLMFGHLNLVSAFIFAILLGLGIDFGVHVLSRYRDQRAHGDDRLGALTTALTTTGVSTSAGALSTAGSFLVLAGSTFQGFAQFGVVAAVGVIFALIAALVLIPALVRTMGGKGAHTFGARPRVEPSAGPTQAPRGSAIALVIAVVLAGLALWQLPSVEFEYDLSKLGSKRSKPSVSKDASAPVAKPLPEEAVGKKSAPGIILTDSLEKTALVHRQLATLLAQKEAEQYKPERLNQLEPLSESRSKFRLLKEKAKAPVPVSAEVQKTLKAYPPEQLEIMKRRVTEIFSIYDYVPDGQTDKLTIIKDIKKRVDRKRRKFKGKDKEEVDELYSYLQVTEPITVEALPSWVKSRMTDRTGAVGQFVVFRASGSKANYEIAKELRTAFFDIKTPDGTAPTAAEYFILAAIIDAIKADAPMVISLTLLVMFISAFLLVGNIRGPLVVFTVVGFALVWLGGIMACFGWKLDMFNIIAIPLIVGMGQDDALHIYHRYEEGGPNAITRAVRETGAAIFLTTWTTCIGFGGIFFSNHRGLLSLAKISVVGLILCFVSSVIVLPALLRVLEWRKASSTTPST